MKCPNCGYFNMPGATVCGSCRRALNEAPAASEVAEPYVPMAEIYPPRASKRTARQQAEAHSPTVRRANRFVEADWERTRENARLRRFSWQTIKANFRGTVRWWCNSDNLRMVVVRNIPPLISLIPGMGQLLQSRYSMAAILFLLFIPSLSIVVNILIQDWNVRIIGWFTMVAPLLVLPYSLFLNGLIFAFCALVWFSVWDAAKHSYPSAHTTDYVQSRFRNLRLAYGSALYVAIVLGLFFWWLSMWRN